MAAAGWRFLVARLARTQPKVSYVCRGSTLLRGSLRLQTVALKRARVLVLVRFINCLVSTYCRQSWGLVKRKKPKDVSVWMNVDSATWGRRRHFHRVFNLAALWEIKGPSDVLPVPLKMHRAPLLICFLLPFSLCAFEVVNLSCLTHKCVCVCAACPPVLIIQKNRGSTKGPLPVVLVPMQHNAGEQEQQTPATVTWIYLPSPPWPH